MIPILKMIQMKFSTTLLDYDFASQNTILDYHVTVEELGQVDRQLFYGELGNFSLAGFQFSFKVLNIYNHCLSFFLYLLNYGFPLTEAHGQVCVELSLPFRPVCLGKLVCMTNSLEVVICRYSNYI